MSPLLSLAERGPVKIGICVPLTGVDAPFGQSVSKAISVAHALRPAVLDNKIELHFFDTKSDDTLTSQGMEALITTSNVHAVIGGTPDDRIPPGSAIAEKERIPVVYPFVTYPLAGQNNKYTFTVGATNSSEAKAAALFASKIEGANKAAVMIDVSQDYSLHLSSIFMSSFIEKGGKVVSATYYQWEDKKLTEQITSIVAAKPDILYLPDYPAAVALACRCAMESDLRIPIISSIKARTHDLIKEGKDTVEGVTVPGYFAREAVTSDLAKQFIETYKKGTGEEVSTTHALSADSYFLLIDAIERAKSLKGYKIRKALAETKNFDALSGRISIDAKGTARRGIVFHRIKEGKFEYLTKLNP